MKTPRKTYLFFLLISFLVACTEHGAFECRLALADSLMNEQPDSAYRILCSMDTEAKEMPQSLRMRHLLMRSNAQNKVNVDFTSDSTGNVLVSYYNTHGTSNERMLAHYVKGCTYRDMEDQPASLRCFNDAVAAADTSATDCDFYQLSIIYEQIAKIFNDRAMSDNALQAYEYAENYARKIQDSIGIYTIWDNKSNALINMGNIEGGLILKEKVVEGFRKMGDENKAARSIGGCIKWYARKGDFDKAQSAINDYETHSGFFMENGKAKPGKESYYSIKGTYFLEKGQMDSAEHYFRKLLYTGTTRNDQYLASWGLTQMYYYKDQLDSVGKYALQAFLHSDTLYNIGAAQSLQNTQAMYNYARHQENALRKEMEAKDTQLRYFKWIIGSIITIVPLSLLILFLYRKDKKNSQKLNIVHKENVLLHTQIQENAELILSLNNQLTQNEADIETLVLLKESTALLSQRCQELEEDIRRRDALKVKGKVENETIVKRFLQMAKSRNTTPNAQDWAEIISVVENFYASFALHIKSCPNISRNEYQVCVLTKLGLRVGDIAYLTGNSSSNITNIRSRMMTKIFGEEGGAKDFDARISIL